MNRRKFLSITAGSCSILTSGCVSREALEKENEAPASQDTANAPIGIDDWGFRIDTDTSLENIDAKPRVICLPDLHKVRIAGKMWSGDPCTTLGVERLDLMNLKRGVLKVVISLSTVKRGVCPDSLSAAEYEAMIEFNTSLPGTIVAVESIPDDLGQTQRTTKRCNSINEDSET